MYDYLCEVCEKGFIRETVFKNYVVKIFEKYVPVNLQHRDTIEVRIFKGNLIEPSFRKNVEFIDSLYYFTKYNPLYKLELSSFIEYAENERKTYPNLIKFLSHNSNRLKKILEFPLEVPEGLYF